MCCHARRSAHHCCVEAVILPLVQYLLITAGVQPWVMCPLAMLTRAL